MSYSNRLDDKMKLISMVELYIFSRWHADAFSVSSEDFAIRMFCVYPEYYISGRKPTGWDLARL